MSTKPLPTFTAGQRVRIVVGRYDGVEGRVVWVENGFVCVKSWLDAEEHIVARSALETFEGK